MGNSVLLEIILMILFWDLLPDSCARKVVGTPFYKHHPCMNSDMVVCSAGSKKWWARHEVLWTDEEKFLAAGAAVVQQLREKVRKKIMRAHVGGAVTAL